MVEEDIEFTTFDGDVITKNTYRDEVIDKYVTSNYDGVSKVTDFSTGSEALHLADVIAGFLLDFRVLIDSNYQMSMIHTMVGEFLDNHGDMVGVHRIQASPSTGTVTFDFLESVTPESLEIPDGLVVATDDSISFLVDLDGVDTITIDADNTPVTVNAICELTGEYTNVKKDRISLILDSPLGNYLSVTNTNDFTEGTDIESDDDYRNRILESSSNAPTGSLEWYNNTAMEKVGPDYTIKDDQEVVHYVGCHDLRCDKSSSVSYDIDIIFNPVDRTETDTYDGQVMTSAEANLRRLFDLTEYCIAGVNINYGLSTQVSVLVETGYTYYFALLLESNYTLNMVKDNVKDIITQFNKDANVSNEFSPSTLASLIENSVTGISTCKIVKYNTTSETYVEVVDPVEMEDTEVYKVDMTSIDDRIIELSFNLCITPSEG